MIIGDTKMADLSKIEQMLESLVNEDKAKAEELFHEFVIEKSREIYEGLLESDLEDLDEAEEEDDEDEVEESADEEVDESEEDELEEGFDLEEFEVEADDEMGGDPMDDMLGDIEAGDDEGDDEEGEEDEELEDRVVDLEDALDELKAEFDKMMSGDDEGDDEGDDMDMDDEDEEAEKEEFAFEDEEVEEAADEEVEEAAKSETEQMREYVEKVAAPKGEDNKATSPVAGKNDMGGTSANIASGSAEEKGGTADSPKEDNAGNVNVPGAKASKSMKAQPKGHGAEKKGAGESGTDAKSTLGS